jgi:coenzyme F420-reducing hydrogenase alpha subunit
MSRQLLLEPVARVEGHGRVRVTLEDGAPPLVELAFTESPRLFEQLLVGRSFDEVADISCRICSICSAVHKVVAVRAVEEALGVEPPHAARLWRRLLVAGGQIESHSLHLFALLLPDLKGLPGLPALAAAEPELLRQGLAIKAAGNLLLERVGGRLIHPANVVVGGMASAPGMETLHDMTRALAEALPLAESAVELFAIPPLDIRLKPRTPLALQTSPATPLFGNQIARGGGSPFPVAAYRQHLTEEVREGSNATFCRVDGKTVVTGALPRLLMLPPQMPKASRFWKRHRRSLKGHGMETNPLAQAIELVSALEDALEICRQLEGNQGRDLRVAVTRGAGRGAAACEAPRGLLLHCYTFDEGGICTAADIVTPTALNQRAMAKDLQATAAKFAHLPDEELTVLLSRLVRCYDPCISCAVHLVRI